jgi:hypothetical protein
MTTFTPAVREQSRARVAITGPSGSGKTYTSLRLAHEIGERIAVVDTSRRRARLYAGVNGWEFNVFEASSFAPVSLVDTLTSAAAEDHDVVIIDTLSSYWSGPDGHLEQVDKHTRGGWNEERPHERMLVEAILTYPGHVIVTLRSKTEYVVDRDENGHAVARRIGLKPEQREGIEYEFDVVADIDTSHTMRVASTRVPGLSGEWFGPGSTTELADMLNAWLIIGEPVMDSRGIRDAALAAETTADLTPLVQSMDHLHLRNAVVLDEAGVRFTLRDLLALRFEKVRVLEAQAAREAAAAAEPEGGESA